MAEKSKKDIILMIVDIIACIGVVVFSVLEILDIWVSEFAWNILLLGVIMLLQAYRLWQKHRRTAIFSLCVAILSMIVAVIIWLL